MHISGENLRAAAWGARNCFTYSSAKTFAKSGSFVVCVSHTPQVRASFSYPAGSV